MATAPRAITIAQLRKTHPELTTDQLKDLQRHWEILVNTPDSSRRAGETHDQWYTRRAHEAGETLDTTDVIEGYVPGADVVVVVDEDGTEHPLDATTGLSSLAQDEHARLMAWERNGRQGNRPATITYDQLLAGQTGVTPMKKATAPKSKPVKADVPVPTPSKDTLAIGLRTDRQVGIVTEYGGGAGVTVVGFHVVVSRKQAQAVYNRITKALPDASMFERRVLDYTLAMLVLDGDVDDERTSTHAKLLAAGRAATKSKAITQLGVAMRTDGTLVVAAIDKAGKTHEFATQKDALTWVQKQAGLGAIAKAAPKKAAPAKRAAAKKVTA